MKTVQNTPPALVQEHHEGETSGTTLHGAIDALIQSFHTKATTLNKKCRTRNNHIHWIARGRQQALQRVSAQLHLLEVAFATSSSLYLAVQDYLACLEKYCLDAEEEQHTVRPGNGLPIERWKAEGEAQELPRIIRTLCHIVQAHTPDAVHQILSLDGKTLVSLDDEPDEHCQAMDWSAPPTDPCSAGELDLAGDEHYQEPALSPASCQPFVPALGPFPILPDGINDAQQALLLGLEDALSCHTRVLVDAEYEEAEDTVHLLLLFLDRVLQYMPLERLLVITGSALQLAHLCQRYRTWVSLEDGVPLSEHYAAQYKPTAPLAPETQICFSSVHEMDQVTRSWHAQDAMLYRQTYDLIIVYDLISLTASWQWVLASFDAPYRVGFGPSSDPLVAGVFDDTVITFAANAQAYESGDGQEGGVSEEPQ